MSILIVGDTYIDCERQHSWKGFRLPNQIGGLNLFLLANLALQMDLYPFRLGGKRVFFSLFRLENKKIIHNLIVGILIAFAIYGFGGCLQWAYFRLFLNTWFWKFLPRTWVAGAAGGVFGANFKLAFWNEFG